VRHKIGTMALKPHARDISVLLGSKVSTALILDDLDRFVNDYKVGLVEARRAVLVLHGIPPGLAGPSKINFTWQSELDAFC